MGVHPQTVRRWLQRCNEQGVEGLEDRPRPGRTPTSTPEAVSAVIAISLTTPRDLGLPVASWTLDRLTAYRNEERGIAMQRSRIDEVLLAEGAALAKPGALVRRTGGPRVRGKKGWITKRSTEAPAGCAVVCLDELEPEGAKSFPGPQLVRALPDPDG